MYQTFPWILIGKLCLIFGISTTMTFIGTYLEVYLYKYIIIPSSDLSLRLKVILTAFRFNFL
jgi:hypothetical protein